MFAPAEVGFSIQKGIGVAKLGKFPIFAGWWWVILRIPVALGSERYD